jgi:hypothetical protein
MFDTDLYQQVLGLTAPWKVTDVRLDVESTEIHVHVEHRKPLRIPSARASGFTERDRNEKGQACYREHLGLHGTRQERKMTGRLPEASIS